MKLIDYCGINLSMNELVLNKVNLFMFTVAEPYNNPITYYLL